MAKNKKIKRNNNGEQYWGLDDDGNSILHVAAATGRLDLLQLFYLDRTHQTDINAQNFMGWTPLMQAARFGHFNCVEFLCKYVDLFKKNKYGLTAIALASAHGDLKSVKLLFECMLHFGCKIRDFENPISPLTFSVLFGHIELAQFFLANSFNIYHQSIRTEITAFDCAKILNNKQIMDFLEKSPRFRSNENIVSSTLIKNSSTSIPRISVSEMPRTGSGVSGSVSSLDLSPISPVFLNNNTFTLENSNSRNIPSISVSGRPRTGSGVSGSVSSLDLSPISSNKCDNFSKKSPILGGSMNVPRRLKSNESLNNKLLIANSSHSTRRASTGECNKKQNVFPCEKANNSVPNKFSTTDNLLAKSPNGCNGCKISPKCGSPNSARLLNCMSISKKSPNNTLKQNSKIQNHSPSNNTLKRASPIENSQRSTPCFNSTDKSQKQIFFPPDFEIPNRSATNSLKRLSLTNNLQLTLPNRSSVENRSADRLSPMAMNMKTNFLPVKCSPKSISPKNTCTKTVIAQKEQTTTANYNGNIYQQVTKTYVVKTTTKSPLSIRQDCNKMVNTNSNLQLDSKMVANFDSKHYKCPNESFYKIITILQTNGLGKLVPLFINEEIDYEIFLTLSVQDMIDIGITSEDDHKKILNIISRLLIL